MPRKKIVVWGINKEYESIYNQLKFETLKGNIEVIALCCRACDKFCNYLDNFKLVSKEELSNLDFDYIVIASKASFESIKKDAISVVENIEKTKNIEVGLLPYEIFLLPGFDFSNYLDHQKQSIESEEILLRKNFTQHNDICEYYLRRQDCLDKIRKVLPKFKFVHLCWDFVFTQPFIDSIEKYCNSSDHIFLVKYVLSSQAPAAGNLSAFKKISGSNVFEIFDDDIEKLNFDNNKVLIFHSLCDGEWVNFLYTHYQYLRKSYWKILGADLTSYKFDHIREYVAKHFLGYIDGTGEKTLKEKLNLHSPKVYKMPYVFPISKQLLDEFPITDKANKTLQIQLHNGCCKTTLNLVLLMAKYAKQDVKIVVNLAYGDLSLKQDIINYGTKIFGNRFLYIDKTVAPKEYAKHLMSNDILIMDGTENPQGFGITVASLYLAKKVFTNVSHLELLKQNDCYVFDTNIIKDLSFEDFIKFDKAKALEINKMNAGSLIDNAKVIHQWSDAMEDMLENAKKISR